MRAVLPAFYDEVSILTVIARGKRLRSISAEELPLSLFLLSAFLTAGIFCGYFVSRGCAETTAEELRRYFDGYFLLAAQDGHSAAAVLRTLLCYFRAPLLVFLSGFASVGVVLIPLVCACEGFLTAFSLCCFAAALGRGSFALLPAMFALRLLFVLPCMMVLSVPAIDRAKALALFSIGSGKRVRPAGSASAYWYRFGIVCVCLLIGSVLELWLLPQLLLLGAA